jgi:outer membrane protein insertion porin family
LLELALLCSKNSTFSLSARSALVIAFLSLCFSSLLASCTYHKHLPANTKLLWQNRIKFTDKKILSDYDLVTQLNAAILQQPNTVAFDMDIEPFDINVGTKLPRNKLAIYNLFYKNIRKDSNSELLQKRVAEAPVAYKSDLVQKSKDIMKSVLANHGYWYATVKDSVVETAHKVSVYYIIAPNKYFTVKDIQYVVSNPAVKKIIDDNWRDKTLNLGDKLSKVAISAERDRISALLISKGYYRFRPSAIVPNIDTLDIRKLAMIQNGDTSFHKQSVRDDNTESRVTFIINDSINKKYALNVYRINKVTVKLLGTNEIAQQTVLTNTRLEDGILFNFNKESIRLDILARSIFVRPGQLFSPASIDESIQRLNNISALRNVSNNFAEVDTANDLLNITFTINLGVRFFNEFELTGSNAQTYDVGAGLRLLFSDNNFLRRGNQLSIAPQGGLQFQITDQDSTQARNVLNRLSLFRFDYGVNGDLKLPRFLFFNGLTKRNEQKFPQTDLQVGYRNYSLTDGFGQNALTSKISYIWKQNSRIQWSFTPIQLEQLFSRNLETIKDLQLRRASASFFIAGHSARFIYSNKLDKFQHNYTYVRLGIENSGAIAKNLLPTRLIAQYNMLDAEVRHYINSSRVSWVNRIDLKAGIPNSGDKNLPFNRQIPIGGANSLRGWRTFRVGPGSTQDSTLFLNVGDMKGEGNSELRFKVTSLFNNLIGVEGATFLDAGNVWRYSDEDNPNAQFRLNKLYRDLAVNTGLGLRLDFSFAILRVDYGVQLKQPYKLSNNGWLTKYNSANSAVAVSIGYPFQ